MRTLELRELVSEDLRVRLSESKEEYFNLRFQNATGQLENYKRLGIVKRDIARIETVLREREFEEEAPSTPVTEEPAAEVKRRRAARKWGRRANRATEEPASEDSGAGEESGEEPSDE